LNVTLPVGGDDRVSVRNTAADMQQGAGFSVVPGRRPILVTFAVQKAANRCGFDGKSTFR
jgi:hypothetical protein